jgi:tungstate transport system ATP-binding protein
VSTPACATRDLAFSFGDLSVLRGVDLELKAGEVSTLVGGNGSGKSTLLQLIALLLRPDGGELELAGERVHPRPDRLLDRELVALRRRVTLLHQRPALFDDLVAANVAFGLRVRGVSRGEVGPRVTRALTRVGLTGFERRRARALSGGEVQRVVLARALVLETPVLLLDEPFSYLDGDARPLLLELVGDARERGAAVLISTHEPGAAATVSDRLLKLADGRLTTG